MWLAVWLATIAASALALFSSWQLTSEAFQEGLEDSLATQVEAQAAMAAAALRSVPVETVAALKGTRSLSRLQQDLDQMRASGGLHDLALIGPDATVIGSTGRPGWVVADADAALIDQARANTPRVGPLYQGADDAVYLAAYSPLFEHPGWVVAVEASGAPMEAATAMRRKLAWVSGLVMILAVGAGAGLAAAVTRPLRRLARELGGVRPGDPPKCVALHGPLEVQLVGSAARQLLDAVRDRDAQLRTAHEREIRQLSALAAAVAHEVRNPLNAIGLAFERLARTRPPSPSQVHDQVRCLLDEIDGIVERFMDLSRPADPVLQETDLSTVLRGLAVDAAAAGVELVPPAGEACLVTDPHLLRQALRNLLRNAAQAAATTVRVRIVGTAPLILDIEDNGKGIPDAEVGQLFDWFHTTRAQGSGLGLPSARRALRSLGGDLQLVNRRPAVFRATIGGG
ncbi:MAG: HAMP domain-containing histidine kinase [Oligoflexia bacterium]|nr:HAMP domain-containing histidine kinase [Oligoflexia bacterium]